MSTSAAAARPAAKRVSERQLAANRANAAKSTGPRTESGKAISRENSMKHGLAARRVVLPCEDPVTYHDIRGDLLRYWKPVGAQEMMLVDQIAQSFWRIRRSRAVETEMLDLEIRLVKDRNDLDLEPNENDLTALAVTFVKEPDQAFRRFFRYDAAAERAYYRAILNLRMLQKDRQSGVITPDTPDETAVSDSGNGFVAQTARDLINPAPHGHEDNPTRNRARQQADVFRTTAHALSGPALLDSSGQPQPRHEPVTHAIDQPPEPVGSIT